MALWACLQVGLSVFELGEGRKFKLPTLTTAKTNTKRSSDFDYHHSVVTYKR